MSDSATPRTAAHQASLSITNPQSLLKLMSIESMMPSNHLILCCPLLLLPSILPSIGVFSNESVLCIRWPNTGASTLALVFPMNIQDWFPLGLAGLISLWPRNSHESSPTPQFKSINSLVLSFIYGPVLTSIHDYWKNHSFDYSDLCQYSNHMTEEVLQKLVYRYEQTSSKVYVERQQTQTSQHHSERTKLENY